MRYVTIVDVRRLKVKRKRTRLRVTLSGVRTPLRTRDSPLLLKFQNGYGAQPASYSKGVSRPSREVNHSSPSSAKVKNEWSCTFTPLYAFTARTEKNTFNF